MKMIFLTYNDAQNDEVMEILGEFNIPAYCRFRDVQATTLRGRPRMGTHTWPGYNYAITFALEEEVASALFAKIREFNKQAKYEGIQGMSWTVDDICQE